MKVTLAESAGFCYGVRRAVELAEKTARESHGGCYLLGDLIHNTQVVAALERQGAHRIEDPDKLGPGDTVVIRSHGERREILENLQRRGVRCVDATCPNVRRIQKLVAQAESEGRLPIVIGDPLHPEVEGIASQAAHTLVFDGPETVREWVSNPQNREIPVTVAAQTTCIRAVFENSWDILKKECTNAKKFDTICNATRERQAEAARIAAVSDVMIVAGDRKSANTGHLTDICRKYCPRVFQIENADGLSPEMFAGCAVAGLTAGASTPACIIKEVIAAMSEEIKSEDVRTEETVNDEPVQDETVKADESPAAEDTAATEETPAAEPVQETVETAAEASAPVEDAAPTEEVPAAEASTPAEESAPVQDEPARDGAEGKEESFEELLNRSIKTLNNGEKVTGIVRNITQTEVEVDVGAKQTAYIKLSELSEDPNANPEDIVHVGQEIEAYVVRVNDVEGYAELSKKRLDAQKKWEEVERAVEDKTIQEGVVTEDNKGGIVVSVDGIRVFVPASQSGKPRGADLSAMRGETVRLRITEYNRARRRVVGSIRSVLDEERRAAQDKVWADIEEGKRYTGTVKSMTSYGVFVDIGGVDGMVHISELSWSRIRDPKEVCKVGDTLDVYVISFDPERRKISLGVKDHNVNPWDVFMNTYRVNDIADVRVVKLMSFGAFAEVVPGVDGLIHISQIARHRVEKPEDELSEGQIVRAKIINIDEDRHKISLSMREAVEDEYPPESEPLYDE